MFKKRVITGLVALALFATSVTPAFAEDTQNGSADGTTNQANPNGTLVNPAVFNDGNQKGKFLKKDIKNNMKQFGNKMSENGFEKEKGFEMGMKNFEDDEDFDDEMEEPKIDLVCMQTAVEKKENAEIAATDTFNTGIKTAMTVRRDALKSAWGIEDRKIREEATKKAWKDFRRTMKTLQKVMNKAMRTAVRQFEDDSYDCGVEGGEGNVMF